jgi:acetolactate synthase I/II/III large subunit
MLAYRKAEVAHPKLAADDPLPDLPAAPGAADPRGHADDGIICLDNGVYKIWFARGYTRLPAQHRAARQRAGHDGRGPALAMMSAMVYPDRKVMAICGDGGFMMNSQEMETAVRLGLNLTVLILRDDAYGMIRWKQANMGLPTSA